MGEVKQINIKNRTYYFYNDITDLKNFEPNLLKIDKKSYKNIDIYYIGPIAIKKIDDYDQIVVSDKFRHSDEGFKYFIGYQDDEIVKPLSIILPQMSGYIKYFENGGKNMSFMVKDDNVLGKYNKIWIILLNKD